MKFLFRGRHEHNSVENTTLAFPDNLGILLHHDRLAIYLGKILLALLHKYKTTVEPVLSDHPFR